MGKAETAATFYLIPTSILSFFVVFKNKRNPSANNSAANSLMIKIKLKNYFFPKNEQFFQSFEMQQNCAVPLTQKPRNKGIYFDKSFEKISLCSIINCLNVSIIL